MADINKLYDTVELHGTQTEVEKKAETNILTLKQLFVNKKFD